MSLAVAITDGRISIDDPVSKYVPQWAADPQKQKITIRQLGSHTSGLEDSSVEGYKHTEEPGWKGVFWKRLDPPDDPFTLSRDAAQVLFEPGTDFQYSNPGIAMLTYAVTSAMQGNQGEGVRAILRERLMRPIGAPDSDWSIGYGQTFVVDGHSLVGSWGGGGFAPRTAARIGRLVLRKGDWDGTRLLSAESIQQVTGDAGLPGHCGMGWWTNADGRLPDVPRDAVWGAGAGNQILLVIPSLNLIMVRNGAELFPRGEGRDRIGEVLFDPLLAAIVGAKSAVTGLKLGVGQAPYPQSKLITNLEWAPRSEIKRAAEGSDNWPITWGDDDLLYSAYGDGHGFEPFVERKLSLGYVTISGGPLDFQGHNLRTPTGERRGEGKNGPKASGMLMVDGVLYMFARNTDHSQLAWSKDKGRVWEWADWKFTTSFGCPTFLNFGPNYAGARDEYVYVYSLDSDTAYDPADRMILARVPKDRIGEQQAYEYFRGLDSSGTPAWTAEIEGRGAVFEHPGRCYRSGITWHPGLKRYLWCQILPESTDSRGPRFQGGFGIYEGPEPWGPWSTVFFENTWDVGPGESSSLPAKWFSEDGRTVYLVSSGDDCFSVREARLTIAE
jgi:hypothetical protein